MKLTDRIHRVTTCYPTFEKIPMAAFIIVTEDAVALVDAVIPESITTDIEPYMQRLGLELRDIDVVIVTHGHPDHCGGLGRLREARPDLEVLCSASDRSWIENHQHMWDELFARYEPDLAFGEDVERYIIDELCGDEVTGLWNRTCRKQHVASAAVRGRDRVRRDSASAQGLGSSPVVLGSPCHAFRGERGDVS